MLGVSLIIAAASFTLSASAGLGGSLLLVPALALLLGAKDGVATAALLLASNNVAKVVAYRDSIPLTPAAAVIAYTVVGAWLGAGLLVRAPERVVHLAVVVGVAAALAAERMEAYRVRRGAAPLLAFTSGASSGFSGTSGPLKGIALRSLGLDRRHFVGAASAVSLAGDATKVVVFMSADLLSPESWQLVTLAIPLMVGGTWLGKRLNQRIGERGYALLFWSVMTGYTLRLLS